ncbi:RES family NAD+ phosphorylase [Acidithiobacillus sp. MC6.1]|nr:RES family NAD+ phosphorylase [Acidithiobacillus sp. MC6.1]
MHAGLQSGARIDIGSLPNQRRISPAKRLMKASQAGNLIKRLHRMVERKSSPEVFLEPLGNLLDGTQHKGAFLTDVTFYRARQVATSLFTHVNELKYPPKEITPKGRLNREGSPILYAAFSPAAALVEVSAKVGQIVAIATIEELPGHADQVHFFPVGVPLSSPYATPTRDKKEALVHDYLNSEITKRVDKGSGHQYNSTIAIADNFLGKPVLRPREGVRLAPGLIYPSVQAGQPSDENSYNVAMEPEVFDAHYHIVEVKAYNCLSLSEISLINRATVNLDGSIQWEDKTYSSKIQ